MIQCDAGLTYIGKSTRHVVTRAKEHLNLGSLIKSKIKEHITVFIAIIVIKIYIKFKQSFCCCKAIFITLQL